MNMHKTGHTDTNDIMSGLKTSVPGETTEWVYCIGSIKSLSNAHVKRGTSLYKFYAI